MFGFIKNYLRSRQRHKTWEAAYDLSHSGRYAEAAEIYVQRAAQSLGYNQFMYANDCIDAFKMWLQAKNIEKALEQAYNVFQISVQGNWLKDSMDSIEDLSKIVGELYLAGYGTEAAKFADEVNEHLRLKGLAIRILLKESGFNGAAEGRKKSVVKCPQCGGNLPSFYDSEIKCPYCGSVAEI